MIEVEQPLTERYMSLAIVKMAILLTFVLLIFGAAASFVAERYQSVATNSLLFCMAFFLLSNGVVGVLQIVDWFEARKAKLNA